MPTKKKISTKNKSRKSPQKKNRKKRKYNTSKKTHSNSKQRMGLSFLVIIIIAVIIFFYLNNIRDNGLSLPADDEIDNILENINQLDNKELSFYYPSADLTNGGIIEHQAFSLDYNEDFEQADWVFYELTKSEVENKLVSRQDNFQVDPSTSISSALPTDYYKSGFDRGHLCPAADNRWSEQAMSQSFYMSNISPQDPELNRKIWAELEMEVRNWAIQNEKVYIATGPILADGSRKMIGESKVGVPNYFYKVIADLSGNEIKGIGFIFVNGKNNGELKYYACSIDEVEKRTKIDFFFNLDKELQIQIESDFQIEDWF